MEKRLPEGDIDGNGIAALGERKERITTLDYRQAEKKRKKKRTGGIASWGWQKGWQYPAPPQYLCGLKNSREGGGRRENGHRLKWEEQPQGLPKRGEGKKLIAGGGQQGGASNRKGSEKKKGATGNQEVKVVQNSWGVVPPGLGQRRGGKKGWEWKLGQAGKGRCKKNRPYAREELNPPPASIRKGNTDDQTPEKGRGCGNHGKIHEKKIKGKLIFELK